MAIADVPSLDLKDFRAAGANSHYGTRFVEELGKAYINYGFCRVSGHRVDRKTKNRLYTAANGFFDLPLETKMKYRRPGVNRGYKGFKEESAKNWTEGDLKEFFHIGRELNPAELERLKYPDNVWPDYDLPGFKAIGLHAYSEFEDSGNQFLEALEIFLGLEKNYFRERTRNGNSVLRLLHYPPIKSDPGNAVRSAPHEDINLVTLLTGADSPGLEILTVSGEWIPINAGHNELVINAGDMLQWFTNGLIRSTTHRVVNPPREKWYEPRISMPFFMHPDNKTDLTPPEQFVTAERPQRFGKITAGEYLDQRLGQNYKTVK